VRRETAGVRNEFSNLSITIRKLLCTRNQATTETKFENGEYEYSMIDFLSLSITLSLYDKQGNDQHKRSREATEKQE
jgi:hypothetical protein